MEKIEVEKEYIMLLSISKYGYDAMPQDYTFLSRYSMLNMYLEIVKSKTFSRDIKHIEQAVKQQAKIQLTDMNVDALREYKSKNGNKETKRYLNNNEYYWKALLRELRTK
ncbi:MAG: hypothetical protein RR490_09980 [Niameybacter sp.]